VAFLAAEENYKAYTLFAKFEKYKDAKQRMEDCVLPMPKTGVLEKNASGRAQLRISCTDPDTFIFAKLYATDGSLAQSLFISGKGKVTASVPGGTYTLHVARAYNYSFSFGDLLGEYSDLLDDFVIKPKWFGAKDMFGDSGYYEQVVFAGNPDGSIALKNGYYLPITFGPTKGSGWKELGTQDLDTGGF